MKYPTMKQKNGSQDKCMMTMTVRVFGMCNKDLVSFNRPRTHQYAAFLLDITTPKGDTINKLLMADSQETHKGLLEKNRPTTTFGSENCTHEVERTDQDTHPTIQVDLPAGQMDTSLGTLVEVLA